MRKITIARPQKIQFPLIKGKILIDGIECETVKAGKTITFEIPDGRHDLQVVFSAVPPVNSNVIHIEQSDGDAAFEIKIVVPLKNDETYAELTRK
jgi:hypothetical protein